MTRLNARFLFGAVILVAISVVIVLRTRTAHAPLTPSTRTTSPVTSADSSDVPLATIEPTRALMPLIPPDPMLARSGSVILIGRVLDHETGQPIAKASIEKQTLPASEKSTVVTAHTDEQGKFEIEAPLRESARLRISAAGRATVDLSPSAFVRPHDNIMAGEVFRLGDIHLRRGVQPIVRVLDTDSKPVAGAKLVMCDCSPFRSRSLARTLGATDEHGEWTATEPLACMTQATYLTATSGKTCGFAPLAVQHDGSRGERLDVVLRPAITVEVHAVQLNTPVSRPLAGVDVQLDWYPGAVADFWRGVSRSSGSDTPWLHAMTDSHGIARLLLPHVDGFHDALALSASLDGFETVHISVHVDDLKKPVDLRLQPSTGPTIAYAAMGFVLDATGHPVPGATVQCGDMKFAPDAVTGRYNANLGRTSMALARTISVEAPGYALRRGITPRAADPIVADFVLDPLTSIRGRVVDESGHGIAGIPVQLDRAATDVYAQTRADGTYCLAFAWKANLICDEMRVQAGWSDDSEALYESSTVWIDDPQHVDFVLRAKSIGSVIAHVLDDESSEPAPVVRVVLMQHSGAFTFPMVGEDRIVSDVGWLRVDQLQSGKWEVAVESSTGRVGAATFDISPTSPTPTIEVRVGPKRSIVARVVPDETASGGMTKEQFFVYAEPALTYPHMNLLEMMSGSIELMRRAHVEDDGTFKFDDLTPGTWRIVAEGEHNHSERTVLVTTRADVHVTMYAKPRAESALLQLTNLDSRFDGPLYARVEREHEDPIEFVADPLNGRAQTFSVLAGESHLSVYAMHAGVPDLDARPITRLKLDIPAGSTEVVALYPR